MRRSRARLRWRRGGDTRAVIRRACLRVGLPRLESDVAALEKGLVALEKGVFVSEKGVLALEKGVFAVEKGACVGEGALLR